VQQSFLGLSRDCPKCGTVAPIWDTVCIACGCRILPSGWVKFGGITFVIIGVGLTATLVWLMWWIAGVMIHTNDPGVTNRYTGTRLQAAGIFALLSAVCMFGITYTAIGIWWIMRATRSHLLIRLGIAGYVVIMLGFAVLQWAAD
jgi:hypothetical protein